ncbi:MAG: TolC family protein [Chlorobium sp.]|uniref:TolC family protein n=1 Tax=Chlorobium sp. TaxID=1095 RepID=UPI0025B999B0|nr:TolC family protein [Chlorobium sp.]MCF8383227.1 TolC family protein [Chlorobium sp.]
MKVYQVLTGICLFGALFSPDQAAAGSRTVRLSLEDAVRIARENNYTIRAARSRVDQAQAKITQTRQSYLPKVTLSETFFVTNDPGAALVLKLQQNIVEMADFNPEKLNNANTINDFNTSLQVIQPIFNADAAIGRKVASTAKKAQQLMVARTEESVELQVSRVYYGLILARKNIEAVEQSIATMSGHSREAVKAYNVGLLTKSDKLSTDVRLAELNEQKLMLHDAIKNATDALKVLLNLEQNVTVIPTGDFVVGKGVPSVDEATVPENRSDLMAMQTYREIAEQQGEMARASRLPRVNGFLRTDLHSEDLFSGGSSWSMGVNMQWDIFDGMASEGRLQEAKAQELEARYSYEAARSGSLAEIRKAAREMKTAKARIAVAQQALEESRVSLDYIGTQFKTGMAMTFELLMREGAYTYAKLRLNQARHDFCIARSEFDYYSGK